MNTFKTYPIRNGILKMIFLFPRWDMLIPWRVSHDDGSESCFHQKLWFNPGISFWTIRIPYWMSWILVTIVLFHSVLFLISETFWQNDEKIFLVVIFCVSRNVRNKGGQVESTKVVVWNGFGEQRPKTLQGICTTHGIKGILIGH